MSITFWAVVMLFEHEERRILDGAVFATPVTPDWIQFAFAAPPIRVLFLSIAALSPAASAACATPIAVTKSKQQPTKIIESLCVDSSGLLFSLRRHLWWSGSVMVCKFNISADVLKIEEFVFGT